VTLDTYTHPFEGDLDDVMERLDVASANIERPECILSETVELSHH